MYLHSTCTLLSLWHIFYCFWKLLNQLLPSGISLILELCQLGVTMCIYSIYFAEMHIDTDCMAMASWTTSRAPHTYKLVSSDAYEQTTSYALFLYGCKPILTSPSHFNISSSLRNDWNMCSTEENRMKKWLNSVNGSMHGWNIVSMCVIN